MEVPVYENDAPVGTLQIVPQGLYTVFQTRLPAGNGGVGADSIRPPMMAGAETSGRLIAASAGKRESRSCTANSEFHTPNSEFPLTRLWLVGQCGDAVPLGLLRQEKEGRSFCRRLSRMDCGGLPKKPVRALVLPNGEAPGKAAKKSANESSRTPPPAEKVNNSELRIPNSEFAWRPLSDGSLIDPGRRLLALPWGGGAVEPPARKISLGEREYLLFRY